MTDYEDANGYVSDEEIKRYFAEELEMGKTDNPYEALYILRDGTLISSIDDYGDRSEDHRAITGLISEGDDYYRTSDGANKFWSALHEKTGVIRVVPETGEALIAVNQKLSPAQQEIVKNYDLRVDEYVKLP